MQSIESEADEGDICGFPNVNVGGDILILGGRVDRCLFGSGFKVN